MADKSKNPPEYTYEDAIARAFMANQMLNGLNSITKEAVEILMRRGLKKLANGKYTWNSDLRLRIPSPMNVCTEQIEHYVSKIECPHIIIKATDSNSYMSDEVVNYFLRSHRNNNMNFSYKAVEGGHHVHLNNTELIIPLINKFLLKKPVKDREGIII